MAKNVHQKSIEYIKDNFNINELSNFYVKDFVNDGRNNDFASIKSNPKAMNFVKHTNKLSEMTVSELLNYKVSDFSFFVGIEDYVNFTQKITEKNFPLLFSYDNDYADVIYNLAKNDYYNSMINSLPGIFRNSNLIQDVFHFADLELKSLEFIIGTLVKNRRFITARNEVLEEFEEYYKLISSKNLSTIFKINRIISKRILRRATTLQNFKDTMKLYFIYNDNVTITNDKNSFQYVVDFHSSTVDKEYLDYWLELIYEVIPIWYDIKIVY
jgi:hypothetical protein